MNIVTKYSLTAINNSGVYKWLLCPCNLRLEELAQQLQVGKLQRFSVGRSYQVTPQLLDVPLLCFHIWLLTFRNLLSPTKQWMYCKLTREPNNLPCFKNKTNVDLPEKRVNIGRCQVTSSLKIKTLKQIS